MADIAQVPDWNYKVTVTHDPIKEDDTFDSLDKAKEFAAQRMEDDDVIKVTIKKVDPKTVDEDNASDGERVQE